MTTGYDWAGPVGDVWAAEYSRTDRSFAGLSSHLNAAILAAAPTDAGRAVDLGCGAGQTSIALASARPDLAVIGADLSGELVRIATERAAGMANCSFVAADLSRDAAAVAADADLLLSRHGVMFFPDPAPVFAALRRAVRPGATLVFSCFRAPSLNPWAGALVAEVTGVPPSPAAGYVPGPFAFADPDFVATLLAEAGWKAASPEPVDYHYVAGAGSDPLADAVAFFRRIGPVAAAIRAAPDDARSQMLDRLAAALDARRKGAQISFPAAAWIWRAVA